MGPPPTGTGAVLSQRSLSWARSLNGLRVRATRSLAQAVGDEQDWLKRALLYDAVHRAAAEYGGLIDGHDLTRFERKIFSQNGEDGVILEIFRRIGVARHSFVEFGVGSGTEGNAVLLADVFRWNGLFVECDDRSFSGLARKYENNGRVKVVNSRVRPGNVDALFEAARVPEEPDLLSIDVDGQDYWIWKATRYRPRLVVIEYNASLPPSSALVEPVDEESSFDGFDHFGASLGALQTLARVKGYQLVHTELTGVNAFFVRDDLVESLGAVDPPHRPPNYRFSGHGFPPRDGTERAFTDVGDERPEAGLSSPGA